MADESGVQCDDGRRSERVKLDFVSAVRKPERGGQHLLQRHENRAVLYHRRPVTKRRHQSHRRSLGISVLLGDVHANGNDRRRKRHVLALFLERNQRVSLLSRRVRRPTETVFRPRNIRRSQNGRELCLKHCLFKRYVRPVALTGRLGNVQSARRFS